MMLHVPMLQLLLCCLFLPLSLTVATWLDGQLPEPMLMQWLLRQLLIQWLSMKDDPAVLFGCMNVLLQLSTMTLLCEAGRTASLAQKQLVHLSCGLRCSHC